MTREANIAQDRYMEPYVRQTKNAFEPIHRISEVKDLIKY